MPKTLNRRLFFKQAIGTGLTMAAYGVWHREALGGTNTKPPQPFLAAGYKVGGFTPPRETLGDNYIALYELGARESRLFKVKPDVHSVVINPHNPNQVFGIAKEQAFSSAVDCRDPKSAKSFEALPGNLFSGHGIVTVDGAFLLTTEVFDKTQEGFVVIRRTDNLKVVEKFSSFGHYPHELHFTDQNQTLAVGNGGDTEISLAFIDFKSKKLVEKYLPIDTKQRIRHFRLGPDKSFIIAGWPIGSYTNAPGRHPAKIIVGHREPKNLETAIMPLPAGVDTGDSAPIQYLSIALNSKMDSAAVTCEDNHNLILLDAKKMTYTRHVQLPGPKGVIATPDNVYFAVSTTSGALYFVDSKTLETDPTKTIIGANFNNSHLSGWFPT